MRLTNSKFSYKFAVGAHFLTLSISVCTLSMMPRGRGRGRGGGYDRGGRMTSPTSRPIQGSPNDRDASDDSGSKRRSQGFSDNPPPKRDRFGRDEPPNSEYRASEGTFMYLVCFLCACMKYLRNRTLV